MTTRGTSNSNSRGSSYDRRARREFLIAKFGNGKTIPCLHCRKRMRIDTTNRTWEVDRYPLCGHLGGKYTRDNIVPSCGECNRKRCSDGCRVGAVVPRKIGVPIGVSPRRPNEPDTAPVVRPSSGQLALNEKERVVLDLFTGIGRATLVELSAAAWPGEPRASSWVRNSLRRLRAQGLVQKVDRGTYALLQQTLPMQGAA